MQYISVLVALLTSTHAQTVSGTPEGFGSGTTGGAGGSTVTPSSTDELVSYLGSSDPLTIVLSTTFDFTGTEGTTSGSGCAPWGTGSGCQVAINQNDWCTNYESSAPAVSVSYDNAAITPITVASDKTLIGVGSSGVIKGKGLKIANGVSNIIIQNIAITELNPQYVWGGDAITLDGSSNVWIDHVKVRRTYQNISRADKLMSPSQTSLIGRQHIVSGYNANTGVTISNCEIDGVTSWSATCDGHHYWVRCQRFCRLHND
jgi:pectin lyase